MSTEVQKIYALRLSTGQDLKKTLVEFTVAQQISSGYIITCVGSLKQACIRFAGQSNADVVQQKFEILSLTGTLCPDGVHLHIAIADSKGMVTGGHLMDDNLIYTTAEIVIGEAGGIDFARKQDDLTGYKELVITRI